MNERLRPARSPVPARRRTGEAPTRGVHHLALTTADMKAAVEFYVGVPGMPLVRAMKAPPGLGSGPGNRGNPPYEEIRHYFFDMGNDSLLAFFEIPDGAEPQANRNAIGGMQHVAIACTAARNFSQDDAELSELVRRQTVQTFEEDRAVLESQQRMIETDPAGGGLLAIGCDAGGVAARRIIDARVRAEAQ